MNQFRGNQWSCCGVSEKFLNWFKNYLSVRVQRVVVDGVASQWAPVTSGDSQGSILGSMLFTIFVGDLPNASEGKVTTALYADDTKIFNCVGSDEDWIDHSFKHGTLE